MSCHHNKKQRECIVPLLYCFCRYFLLTKNSMHDEVDGVVRKFSPKFAIQIHLVILRVEAESVFFLRITCS